MRRAEYAPLLSREYFSPQEFSESKSTMWAGSSFSQSPRYGSTSLTDDKIERFQRADLRITNGQFFAGIASMVSCNFVQFQLLKRNYGKTQVCLKNFNHYNEHNHKCYSWCITLKSS